MKKSLWAGRIISAIGVLFMLFDSVSHFLMPAPVVDAFNRLNFPLSLGPVLGAIALVCVILYAIPMTAAFGAILLTGYLGGAVATHLRARDPIFDTIFPILFGVLIWGGVYLSDARLRVLIPIQRSSN